MSPRIDHAGAFEKAVRALVEGFRRELPASGHEVIFGGRKMTMEELHALLDGMAESFEAVHRAERALRQAIADRRRSVKGHRSTFGDAVVLLKHHFGKDSPALALFGLRLAKPRTPLTAEAKARAHAKSLATRKARGTLGRKQRLALGRPPEPTLLVLDAEGRVRGAAVEKPAGPGPAAPADPEPGG